jgi:hypothetical protein
MGNGQWAMGNGQWAKRFFLKLNLPINLLTYQQFNNSTISKSTNQQITPKTFCYIFVYNK